MKTFICDNCKRTINNDSSFTTGYGTNSAGEKICYECIGLHDEQLFRALKQGKPMHLYFSKGLLTNWPGTFKVKPYAITHGRHNIGRQRTDAWFSFGHHKYHGVQIGTNNEVMRVTKLKNK